MTVILNHQQIQEYIPHRHPFVLVDKIIEIESRKRIVGIKNITGSEYFFPGHFPGQPVMPGVLIIEALAQCAATLASYSDEEARGKIFYFAGIDRVRFKQPVVPGDTLKLSIDVDRVKSRLWKVKGIAEVDGVVACEADITAMVSKE